MHSGSMATTTTDQDDDDTTRWHPNAPTFVEVRRRRDILATGLTDLEISLQLRRGDLTRLRHGVYADAHALAAANPAGVHVAHLRAALLTTSEPAYASGPTASLLHGMPIPWQAPSDLYIVREALQDHRSLREPSQHRLNLPSIVITTHASAARFATLAHGLPTVTPAVAAITSGHLLSFTRRVGHLDFAMWGGSTTEEELTELAHEWQHLGGLDANLSALAFARPGAQSYYETYSRLALVRAGLPEPMLQVPFYDEEGLIGFTDMYWPDLNVVGEVDGEIKYATRQDLIAEKRREDRLRALGLAVVRWMPKQIRHSPEAVAASVRRAGRWAA